MNLTDAKQIYKPRPTDAHKGTFGKALLCVGSHGMMGAAILSATSCLRSGVGLCYLMGPEEGLTVAQIAVPEAIYKTNCESPDSYDAIGIGCGLGKGDNAVACVDKLLKVKPQKLVIDADALNIIAEYKWQSKLPQNAILTPHAVEFERISGKKSTSRAEQIVEARAFAMKYKVVVVLKGAGTAIINSDGNIDINTSGNCGLATAGSGDVLTGIITGLLAQGYTPWEAARLGVYLHGLAGEVASGYRTKEGMIARDIIEGMAEAWKKVIY